MRRYKVTITKPTVETFEIVVEAPTRRDAEAIVLRRIKEEGDSYFTKPALMHTFTDRSSGLIRPAHVRATRQE